MQDCVFFFDTHSTLSKTYALNNFPLTQLSDVPPVIFVRLENFLSIEKLNSSVIDRTQNDKRNATYSRVEATHVPVSLGKDSKISRMIKTHINVRDTAFRTR